MEYNDELQQSNTTMEYKALQQWNNGIKERFTIMEYNNRIQQNRNNNNLEHF